MYFYVKYILLCKVYESFDIEHIILSDYKILSWFVHQLEALLHKVPWRVGDIGR